MSWYKVEVNCRGKLKSPHVWDGGGPEEESVADSRTGWCRGRVHRATLSTWESGVLARELRAAGGAVQPASVLPGCQICGAEPTSGASPRGLWDKRGQAGWHQAALGMGPLEEPMWPPAGSHEGALRSFPGVGVNGTFTEVKESQSGLHERWGLGGYGDTQGQLRP